MSSLLFACYATATPIFCCRSAFSTAKDTVANNHRVVVFIITRRFFLSLCETERPTFLGLTENNLAKYLIITTRRRQHPEGADGLDGGGQFVVVKCPRTEDAGERATFFRSFYSF